MLIKEDKIMSVNCQLWAGFTARGSRRYTQIGLSGKILASSLANRSRRVNKMAAPTGNASYWFISNIFTVEYA